MAIIYYLTNKPLKLRLKCNCNFSGLWISHILEHAETRRPICFNLSRVCLQGRLDRRTPHSGQDKRFPGQTMPPLWKGLICCSIHGTILIQKPRTPTASLPPYCSPVQSIAPPRCPLILKTIPVSAGGREVGPAVLISESRLSANQTNCSSLPLTTRFVIPPHLCPAPPVSYHILILSHSSVSSGAKY